MELSFRPRDCRRKGAPGLSGKHGCGRKCCWANRVAGRGLRARRAHRTCSSSCTSTRRTLSLTTADSWKITPSRLKLSSPVERHAGVLVGCGRAPRMCCPPFPAF